MKVPVCVIVGAGPGNGAAFARQFSRAGYRVALLARSRETLDDLTAEIAGSRAYVYDATDPEDAREVFATIRQDLGPPQTLIYNASSRVFGDIDATDPEDFETAWRVNAYGCLLAVKEVHPGHARRWPGKHRRDRRDRLPQGCRGLRRLRLRQGRPTQPGPVPGPPAGTRGHPCRLRDHRRRGGYARLPSA